MACEPTLEGQIICRGAELSCPKVLPQSIVANALTSSCIKAIYVRSSSSWNSRSQIRR
jgi:hypothetical protein